MRNFHFSWTESVKAEAGRWLKSFHESAWSWMFIQKTAGIAGFEFSNLPSESRLKLEQWAPHGDWDPLVVFELLHGDALSFWQELQVGRYRSSLEGEDTTQIGLRTWHKAEPHAFAQGRYPHQDLRVDEDHVVSGSLQSSWHKDSALTSEVVDGPRDGKLIITSDCQTAIPRKSSLKIGGSLWLQ